MKQAFNILYLCTGNSARSIIAEALTNHLTIAFRQALFYLRRRIELFANLPFDSLSRLALQERLDQIGRS